MSIALSGVTFAKQTVTPADDGALYGSILSDGIINGCGISFSAASLVVQAGRLLIGTRECKIPTVLTIPVTGATSGYARVKLSVDLTQTATREAFAQVYADVEYSATEEGFPSLIQQDINAAGTLYQVVLCTMSLGAAGITAIISKLPAVGASSSVALTLEEISASTDLSGKLASAQAVKDAADYLLFDYAYAQQTVPGSLQGVAFPTNATPTGYVPIAISLFDTSNGAMLLRSVNAVTGRVVSMNVTGSAQIFAPVMQVLCVKIR